MFPLRKKHMAFYTLVLAGALLLLFPAFYNGYPLINADVGTYLHSGFKLFIPDDRPVVYGLVLRFFSLNGWSLWLAVLAGMDGKLVVIENNEGDYRKPCSSHCLNHLYVACVHHFSFLGNERNYS